MIDVKEEKNIYLSNFARFEKESTADGQLWVHRLRKAAMKRFTELGFPTTRNEDWKFTNVAPIAKIPFRPADGEAGDGVSAEMLAGHLLGDAIQLVFVNGRYASELSSPRSLLGDLMVTNLAAALHAHPELVEPHLARYAAYGSQAFTALNTAFMADGAFVYLPAEK